MRLGDLRLELCIDHFHSPYCEPSFWNQLLSPSYAHSNVVLLPPSGWHLNCSLSSEKVTGCDFQLSQTLLLINRNHFPICSKMERIMFVIHYWCVSGKSWVNTVIHWLLEKKDGVWMAEGVQKQSQLSSILLNIGLQQKEWLFLHLYPCLPWREQRYIWDEPCYRNHDIWLWKRLLRLSECKHRKTGTLCIWGCMLFFNESSWTGCCTANGFLMYDQLP